MEGSWGVLGASGEDLRGSRWEREGLGGDLGGSWVILRPSWGRPGLCLGPLGTAAAFRGSDPERGPGKAPGEIPGESWEGSRGGPGGSRGGPGEVPEGSRGGPGAPRAPQGCPRRSRKGSRNFYGRSEADFGPIWGPTWGPLGGLRGLLEGTFWGHVFRGFLGAVLGAIWDPTWPPKRTQDGSRKAPETGSEAKGWKC